MLRKRNHATFQVARREDLTSEMDNGDFTWDELIQVFVDTIGYYAK